MYSRFRLLMCLAAVAVLLVSCSSGTVVVSDERALATTQAATTEAATTAEATEQSDGSEDADSDEDAGSGSTEDPIGDSDIDRGARDPAEIANGFGLGGAEQLEGLLSDCEEGNDLACDILFQISGFDSVEETAAMTCGGRSDVDVVFCTAGIDNIEGEFAFDPDSQGLDRVVEACQLDANMTACDFLFYRSPLDSEFQAIGGTCGSRVNVAVPDCRTVGEQISG